MTKLMMLGEDDDEQLHIKCSHIKYCDSKEKCDSTWLSRRCRSAPKKKSISFFRTVQHRRFTIPALDWATRVKEKVPTTQINRTTGVQSECCDDVNAAAEERMSKWANEWLTCRLTVERRSCLGTEYYFH